MNDKLKLTDRFRTFHYNYASIHRLLKLMERTKSGKPLPYPRFVFIEPTNECNYRCPKCPQVTGLGRPQEAIDIELFGKIVSELKPHKTAVALHHSGEPFMHPKLFDMIRIARDAGLYTIVFCNASLIHREDFRVIRDGPDVITFSVDGASTEVYGSLHGGASWEKIRSNIGEFFRRLTPASPIKCVQITMVKGCQTPEQLDEYMRFARSYPFYQTLIKNAFIWPDGKSVTPILEFPPGNIAYPCGHPWLSPAILADGSMVPCCLDARGLYPVGNMKEESFIELYNSAALNRLRKHLLNLEGTPPLALCDSCGIKRLSMPMNRKRRIALITMPIWKRFIKNLPVPIDSLEI